MNNNNIFDQLNIIGITFFNNKKFFPKFYNIFLNCSSDTKDKKNFFEINKFNKDYNPILKARFYWKKITKILYPNIKYIEEDNFIEHYFQNYSRKIMKILIPASNKLQIPIDYLKKEYLNECKKIIDIKNNNILTKKTITSILKSSSSKTLQKDQIFKNKINFVNKNINLETLKNLKKNNKKICLKNKFNYLLTDRKYFINRIIKEHNKTLRINQEDLKFNSILNNKNKTINEKYFEDNDINYYVNKNYHIGTTAQKFIGPIDNESLKKKAKEIEYKYLIRNFSIHNLKNKNKKNTISIDHKLNNITFNNLTSRPISSSLNNKKKLILRLNDGVYSKSSKTIFKQEPTLKNFYYPESSYKNHNSIRIKYFNKIKKYNINNSMSASNIFCNSKNNCKNCRKSNKLLINNNYYKNFNYNSNYYKTNLKKLMINQKMFFTKDDMFYK
jgi:hypothetical protein